MLCKRSRVGFSGCVNTVGLDSMVMLCTSSCYRPRARWGLEMGVWWVLGYKGICGAFRVTVTEQALPKKAARVRHTFGVFFTRAKL